MNIEGVTLSFQNVPAKPLRIFVVATAQCATDLDLLVESEVLAKDSPWNHVARGIYVCEFAWFPHFADYFDECGYTLDLTNWHDPSNEEVETCDPGNVDDAARDWLAGKGILYPDRTRNNATRFRRLNDRESAYFDGYSERWYLVRNEDVARLGELSLAHPDSVTAYAMWRKEAKVGLLSPLQAKVRGLIA